MHRMTRERLTSNPKSESGSAMVAAVIIMVVLMLVSVALVDQTVSGLSQASVATKRVGSTDAADAGIQYVYAELAADSQITCPTSQAPVSGAGGTFIINVTEASGTTAPSTTGTSACSTTPAGNESYLIQSTGTASSGFGSVTKDQEDVYIGQGASATGALDQAIFGNSSVSVQNTLQLTGTGADLYTNGSYSCGQQTVTAASVTVNNSAGATITNNCTITGDLWSLGPVTMSTSGVKVSGWTETDGSITVDNSVNSKSGAAYSSPTFTSSDGYSCSQIYSSCSADGVSGMPTPPSTETFPVVNYSASAWSGWTVVNETNCNNAASDFLSATTSGSQTVINLPSGCTLTFPDHQTYSLKNNVAVFAPGGFSNQNGVTFQSSSSTQEDLYLMVPYSAGAASGQNICATSSPPTFSFATQPTFATSVATLLYTPCTLTLSNGVTSSITGQIYANTVSVGGNSLILNYQQLSVPGATGGGATGSTGIGTVTAEWSSRVG